jgi:hypothetical protein
MSNAHAQETSTPSLETVVKRRGRGPAKAASGLDAEAHAISACSKALTGLDPKAVARVLAYVGARFQAEKIP